MINFLITGIVLLVEFVINFILSIPVIFRTIRDRIKNGYWKSPRYKDVRMIFGDFGAGKGLLTMDMIHKDIARYGKTCRFRILSNMTLDMKQFPYRHNIQYKFMTNIDDVDWLMETDENGDAPFDAGILILDELSSILGNRDFMNSKKGKSSITKNFTGFIHQLRKRKILVILQSQDSAYDVTFKRRQKYVYVPHSFMFNRLNRVKVYRSREFMNYVDGVTTEMPEPIKQYIFRVPDKYFNSYNTKELVKQIAEGDYFRPNDPDAPAHIINDNPVVLQDTMAGGKKKIFRNRAL